MVYSGDVSSLLLTLFEYTQTFLIWKQIAYKTK